MLQTIQSSIKQANNKDLTKYSLFLGGLDVTNKALAQYDPLRTGYARVFFVRKPVFLERLFTVGNNPPEIPGQSLPPAQRGADAQDAARFKSFWHLLEYGFVSVDGIQNTGLEFEALSGGYAGRQFEIPTLSKDETNSITLRVYEMAGSPVREMLDLWITGIADPYTGLAHYQGRLDVGLSQANHTAEMIYVQTDPTGNSNNIEYSCMLCNMVPKTVKKDHFNYESGSHPLVQTDIEFTCTKYESKQINEVAKSLVARQKILSNYTYFQSEYSDLTEITSGTTGSDSWPAAAEAKTL